jgi:hypothetical protein
LRRLKRKNYGFGNPFIIRRVRECDVGFSARAQPRFCGLEPKLQPLDGEPEFCNFADCLSDRFCGDMNRLPTFILQSGGDWRPTTQPKAFVSEKYLDIAHIILSQFVLFVFLACFCTTFAHAQQQSTHLVRLPAKIGKIVGSSLVSLNQ